MRQRPTRSRWRERPVGSVATSNPTSQLPTQWAGRGRCRRSDTRIGTRKEWKGAASQPPPPIDQQFSTAGSLAPAHVRWKVKILACRGEGTDDGHGHGRGCSWVGSVLFLPGLDTRRSAYALPCPSLDLELRGCWRLAFIPPHVAHVGTRGSPNFAVAISGARHDDYLSLAVRTFQVM